MIPMKNLSILFLFCSINAISQEHFSGITTSKRVGIINAGINPSELTNLSSRFEVQIFTLSANVSNNKIGFDDIIGGSDLEDLIFSGKEPVNFSLDTEIYGPSFAMKALGWGFAFTTKANIKANAIDVDPNLGDALSNSASNAIFGSSVISNMYNQRINATTWGEIGLSAAHNIFKSEKHEISGGITLKLLFPGSYANLGLDKFNGTITNNLGDVRLNDVNTTTLNIAYSGGIADNFNDSSNYTQSLFGGLKGLATDVGFNYKFKGENDDSYKIKAGVSIRNIGSMKFTDRDNSSTNYELEINDTNIAGGLGLDLTQFETAESFAQIENILLANNGVNGVRFEKVSGQKDFKVKLPTVLNLYADVKIVSKVSVTAFLQQKVNEDSANDQITSQNFFSVTPRFNIGFFEVYTPIAFNEISGTTGGLGFRLGGFFMGSNSVVTALTSDSKQADFYTGFRFGFL